MLKRHTDLVKKVRELQGEVEDLRRRLELIEALPKVTADGRDSTLFALPDHLRKSYLALLDLGAASASEVSAITHRARAVESSYLNQLILLGHLRKWRDGRIAMFALRSV